MKDKKRLIGGVYLLTLDIHSLSSGKRYSKNIKIVKK